MSQTMEQTEASSIRDNEEPEKKQKSRRPASQSIFTCKRNRMESGDADTTLQIPPSGNND